MSSYYNQGVQVIVGNGQNFPGTPRISLIPFIQNAYDKGLLNFTVLPPGSISLAEIENIATSKILGRSTAGSGVIEQISIGTGLSLSGGTLSSTVTATPGGSDTQIQYNNAGAFGGSSQLIANIGTTNTLDIQGSGSTSATNALRVRNSSGTNLFTIRNDGSTAIGTTPNNDLLYIYDSNVAGNKVNLRINNGNDLIRLGSAANSGHGLISTLYRLNIDGGTDGVNVLGKLNVGSNIGPVAGFTVSTNTTASTPSMLISGTGYSGGTATTTKPTLLIEPTGTTSTGWSTSGTKLGVNAESGFTGALLDLQVNGVSKAYIASTGDLYISSRLNATSWRTSLSYEFYQPTTITSTTSAYYFGSSTIAGTNTDQKFWEITTTINKTGTGSYTLIDANVTETSVPSGVNYLMNLKTGGVSRFNVTNTGALNVTGGTSSGWASTFILGGGNAAHGVINGYANGTCQIYDKGTTGQQNIPNAVLNVSSTAKGFLPPRLSTAERDAVTWVTGDGGMIIFNTTTKTMMYFDSTNWIEM